MRMRSTTLGVLTAGTLLLSACGGGSGGNGGGGGQASPCDNFDCQGMANNLAGTVMKGTFDEFDSRTETLKTEAEAYQTALGDGDPSTNGPAKTDLQDAWKQAMETWQRAELMQVGPLLADSRLLSDTIYSWPSINSCDVDQEVVKADNEGPSYDIQPATNIKRRGLDAMGYLLYANPDSSCPSQTPNWSERAKSDKRQTRADFLVHAAEDLSNQADTLVSEWGNFVTEVEQAGESNSRFGSIEEAVNAFSDALFYLEKKTNDTKLAFPTGIKTNSCGGEGTICDKDLETYYDADSIPPVNKAAIRQNMKGFELLFLGNEPGGTDKLGFSEFLEAQDDDNGSSVAANMESDLNDSFTQLDEVDGSLEDALENDLNDVKDTHDQLGLVNRQLKNQFLRVLGLTIPDAAAGDGD